MTRLMRSAVALVAGLVLAAFAVSAAGARTDHANKVAAGVAYAKAQVKKYSGPTGVPTAGPVIKGGIKSLKGKKIWFVPQSTEIPYIAGVVEGAKEAAAAAGLKIEVCDGEGTTSGESACVQQAITGGGAGVAADGIQVGQVQQAVNALEAKHIPFVQGGLTQAPGNDKVAYVWNDSFLQSKLAADAIIAASKGKANILVIRHTDSPATEAFMDQGGVPQFKKYCPDCKLTTIQINAAQLEQLTPEVSAALEQNPNINYIFAEFDLDVSSVVSALQTLNKNIPIYATTALLPDIERIKDHSYQLADAGTDSAYSGWAEVDQLMRMMLKQPPNNKVPVPVRLFTRTNVASLKLNNATYLSGSWYGATGFEKMFRKLWGL